MTAIEIPFHTKRRPLTAKVCGQFNFHRGETRKKQKLEDWQRAPITSANFAIEIWDAASTKPCARHHLDLANLGQAGPVWHLQLGGLASGEARDRELEDLDVPRWPTLPMDMILVLELAIYNFRPDAWQELRETNPWRDIVKRSEKLVHQHYVDRLKTYRNQHEAGHSWLAFQCNKTSGWDPRPGRRARP